jgi:vitamin B12 transporter
MVRNGGGKVWVFICLLLAWMVGSAYAQEASEERKIEEIVVTATRTEAPASQVASSITSITGAEIEEGRAVNVSELLRNVPGLQVVRTGSRGGSTSLFIRGASSEQTLVLIDGIEANDPMSSSRSFDFGGLTTDNIERIEVLRGPQSTLYGSNAIGGVVNIITRKGKGKPTLSLSVEGGEFETFRESAAFRWGTEGFNASLALSRLDTKGISSASRETGNLERDGYQNETVSGRLGVNFGENTELNLFLRYIDARLELDNCGGSGCDDVNHVSDTTSLFLKGQLSHLAFERWEQILSWGLSDHDRRLNNPLDLSHPADSSFSTFDGQLSEVNWQNNLYLPGDNILTFGVELEHEKGHSFFRSTSVFGPFESRFGKRTATSTGFYIQGQFDFAGIIYLTAGARRDERSRFGGKTTMRVAPVVLLPAGLRLKGSVGTGFKSPSLFQLFSDYGNLALKPEETTGYDIGLERSFMEDRMKIGVTYFRNDFDNLIDFDFQTSAFANIGRAETDGVEVEARVMPAQGLVLGANYTYTDTENLDTGEELLRRPRNRFSFFMGYNRVKRLRLRMDAVYTGVREDMDFSTFPAARVALDGYTLIGLSATYKLTDKLLAYLKLTNILDENYEEVLGYGTEGFGFMLGVKAEL